MAFEIKDNPEDLSEINVTPLVDVMLVLLIIFMITVPLMKNAVQIDLPKTSSKPYTPENSPIRLSVDAKGGYYWNEIAINDEDIMRKLQAESKRSLQTDVNLFADKDVRYERVAQLIAVVQQVGLKHVALMTQK